MILEKRFYRMFICILIMACTASASNSISIVKTASSVLEVQLTNSEPIAGVQFSLHTSSNIVLGDVEHGILTADPHWIVASYKPDDSTVNVLILSLEQKTFSIGQGVLARFPISITNVTDKNNAFLTQVMVTNSHADSLGIAVSNLEWDNRSDIIASRDSKSFVLEQNYPNPFNPSTRITYQLKKAAQVRLSVYDVTGREVNCLVDQYQSIGDYNVAWNTNISSGQKLSSGIYFARLSVDNEHSTRKMIMTK